MCFRRLSPKFIPSEQRESRDLSEEFAATFGRLTISRVGVRLVVHLHQLTDGGMRIALCRGKLRRGQDRRPERPSWVEGPLRRIRRDLWPSDNLTRGGALCRTPPSTDGWRHAYSAVSWKGKIGRAH